VQKVIAIAQPVLTFLITTKDERGTYNVGKGASAEGKDEKVCMNMSATG
jgi:hypothetical protein